MFFTSLLWDPKIASPYFGLSDVTDGGRSISVKSNGDFTVRRLGEKAGLSHRLRIHDTQTIGGGQSEGVGTYF